MSKIFSEKFLKVDSSEIVEAINLNGYYACEGALNSDFLKDIENDVEKHRFHVNKNQISGAYTGSQYFLTNILACSKAFFDYCTHQKVLNVCREFMGNFFRVKALRYYETYGNMRMAWHTDSKNSKGFEPITGLIFIAYISDVNDGEFQYIQGSHEYSRHTGINDFGEGFISNLPGSAVSFKMPKGSIIVYNTHGIHRAKPVFDSNFVRKSLFFQVDNNDKSEPILVNTSYFDQVDDTLKMYLGFGRDCSNIPFPETDVSTIPDDEMRNILTRSSR